MSLTVSEADFQAAVIDYAWLRQWLVTHFRPARTMAGYRTPITGTPGFPDLVLARDGVVLIAELKRQHARVAPMQQQWLTQIGGIGRLWRPSDWPEIMKELR